MPGTGAASGSYRTAINIERCKLEQVAFSGGALDVYKCFDQIVRMLLYTLLRLAGMPEQIVSAYERFLEELAIHNTVAGGIGQGYHKPCSIPQGCPFSMMGTAVMMRPWLKVMETLGAEGRILADDIFLMATGETHLDTFVRAYEATHEYVQDLGGKLVAKKSMTFSSCKHARKWLDQTQWRRIGTRIPVKGSFRDLGTHLCTNRRKDGTTYANRLHRATKTVRKVKYLPVGTSKKCHIIRTKILPMGLYGCESSHVNEVAMRHFRSAIAQTITHGTKS